MSIINKVPKSILDDIAQLKIGDSNVVEINQSETLDIINERFFYINPNDNVLITIPNYKSGRSKTINILVNNTKHSVKFSGNLNWSNNVPSVVVYEFDLYSMVWDPDHDQWIVSNLTQGSNL